MVIEENPLRHWIDNFYGYGSWQARFWFIGHEEGGGDLPEEVAEKINFFHRQHPENNQAALCDIRALYKHVAFRYDGPKAERFTNLYEYRFDQMAILNVVWRNLIAFEHGIKNEILPDLLTYQRNSFTSPADNREALIRLYPLPAPHNHGWYYSWLDLPQFPFLKSRALYQEHLYGRRIQTILQNISVFKPDVVLMYGMNNINLLKQSVQEVFHSAKFKMVKAIKQQIPQHHRADVNGTTLLITTQLPALRHGRVETGFDWYSFGKTGVSGNQE